MSGMARSLAPDRERATIAMIGMILAMLVPTAASSVALTAWNVPAWAVVIAAGGAGFAAL
ncbi:MAG: hypothetical protein EOR84_01265 [Mesorhizobium sp.]|uniref:hypothetical protein n=1 Tax=Mesorhizobium sp. TaxID=1871066 RepID=UPI000FE4DB24|nr:hypothetical protein [Mesorhizobium sp.]RWN03645.1 MAG: hypothetical protein EOR84_01265 [Mesorhizobium sp.]